MVGEYFAIHRRFLRHEKAETGCSARSEHAKVKVKPRKSECFVIGYFWDPHPPRRMLQASPYRKHFGSKTAHTIVRDAVLELTYTSHDMAPFAVDLGYVDQGGNVLPPFRWDDDRRLHLRAKLDAVYFHLYGVTNREDVLHIFSTFPIVEREDLDRFETYRTRELCLAYMSALAAGDPDAQISS